MTEFQLSAPIAGPVHTGPTCTWTSPLGEEFTIDYVLIPTAWQDRCRRSSILEELDMGNKNLDHSAYVIEMGWSSQQVIRHGKQEVRGSFDRSLIQSRMPLHLSSFLVADWNINVEEHLDQINSHLHSQLRKFCAKPRLGPSRPYIDAQVWQLRKSEFHHRRQLRFLRHLPAGKHWHEFSTPGGLPLSGIRRTRLRLVLLCALGLFFMALDFANMPLPFAKRSAVARSLL